MLSADSPRADLKGAGYRATGNPLPDTVLADAGRELGAEGLAGATWVIVTINAWNRVATAGHEQAGEYEPGA